MSIINSFLKRRQFLLGAVGSTCALTCNKLGALAVKDGAESSNRDSSVTESQAARAIAAGAAGVRYRSLLSPLEIGNVTLKNRMYSTKAQPTGLQGPEKYPNEALINYFTNVAKNGAAAVTIALNKYDLTDSNVRDIITQLTSAIHFYGAKANAALTQSGEPQGYNISATPKTNSSVRERPEQYRLTGELKEITVEMIQKMNEDFVAKAKLYQSLGFDMVNLYMSYRSSILANSLSPAMNQRTDQYGGTLEKRARLSLELAQAIKKACGQDFLIEAQVSGEEEAGGYTVEDLANYAKIWEGSIDILQLRAVDGTASHPTGYNSQKGHPITLHYAEVIKKSGAKIIVAPNGGYQDLAVNEEYIASGKADMIAMARAFICEPEYIKKAYEGRGEDVTPCVRCNKCHGGGCSVNPKFVIAQRVENTIAAPTRQKKVAVIGGGPAGMRAALFAVERGHKATIYEMSDALGGQLKHADFASFQWPIKDFKDYLIRQVKKAGIEVVLNTKATQEMIAAKKYDAILAATGAAAALPDLPGVKGGHILTPLYAFGNPSLGKNIVVVGGDLIGTQTGMYLAQNGHKVTVLTREKELATDSQFVHYRETLKMAYEALENFNFVTDVTATGVADGKVTYKESGGNERTISADNIIFSTGRKPRREEALKFYGTSDLFFMIGDCSSAGFLPEAARSAYAAASQI